MLGFAFLLLGLIHYIFIRGNLPLYGLEFGLYKLQADPTVMNKTALETTEEASIQRIFYLIDSKP